MEDAFDLLIKSEDCREILIETRKKAGMNRKEFSDSFKIPYRTVQDWELGKRQMPEYLLRLILYRFSMEGFDKNNID